MPDLTPAQYTVLSEISGEWTQSYANQNTIAALERRGLIESEMRGRYALDCFVRLTGKGADVLRRHRYAS